MENKFEKISIDWKSDMAFDANVNGQVIPLDAPQDGSEPVGVRPKPLMLVALAGCTSMDVASLIKKMRLNVKSLSVDISAQKSDQMPIVYTNFHLDFFFVAPEDHKERIIKIVSNSQEKYCGVADMLRKIAPISYNVHLNDEVIFSK